MKTSFASSHKTLYLYIAREFFLSFLVSFLFFFFVFFINQLLLLAEDILEKQVPFVYVMRLIFYSLPSIIAISFPLPVSCHLHQSLVPTCFLSRENDSDIIRIM